VALNAVLYDQAALESREEQNLAPYAVLSRNARRPCPGAANRRPEFRTEFQRDRDRIVHSRSFRRLKQKTQVFMPDEGDHFRTRLSHTLEVAQLGRTLARSLGLNEDLVEAIALGHDLGHAPFGHSGEEALHKIMSGQHRLDGELDCASSAAILWEGFKHNHQSLRILDLLENKYLEPGLNLTHYVREGVLRHTKVNASTGARVIRYSDLDYGSLHLDQPLFLEGQVVALVDEIAQHTHDMEDGLRAGVVDLDEVAETVPLCRDVVDRLEGAGHPNSFQVRNLLIHDVIDRLMGDLRTQSLRNITTWLSDLGRAPQNRQDFKDGLISFSPNGEKRFAELADYVIGNVIRCQEVDRMDARAAVVIPELFKAYLRNPRLLPDFPLERFCSQEGCVSLRRLSSAEIERLTLTLKGNVRYLRCLCDYIAGMTDAFALKELHMMVYPSRER